MKHITNLAGAAVVALLMYLVAKFGEHAALQSMAGGFGLMTQGLWLERWDYLATSCIAAAALTFLIWYVVGQTLGSDFSSQSTKRPIWILLVVLPAIVAVWGVFTLPRVTRDEWLAQAFLFIDALLTFWLMSALFSPSRVKYDPPLAETLRKTRDSLGR